MLRPIGTLLVLSAASVASFAQGPPPPPPGPGPVLVPVPAANPITVEKASLGKALFWDEQLSSTRTIACGSCHIPAAGSSDPRTADPTIPSSTPGPDGVFGTLDDVDGSPGVPSTRADGTYDFDSDYGLAPRVTSRKSPSAINAALFPQRLFWDGRAEGPFTDPLTGVVLVPVGGALENQALGPPVSAVEMGHSGRDWADVVDRVGKSEPLALAAKVPASLAARIGDQSYPQLFEKAFGDAEITAGRIAMAIATYERTLVSDETRDDAFRNGDVSALTTLERQGRVLFYGNIGCGTCHSGVRFSDGLFHYIGVRPRGEDLGRFEVTGNLGDRGAMRTPSLRNVALRAPYFHDGSAANLQEVVSFYDRGADFDAPNRHPLIRPLNLSAGERGALVAYLRTLTDPRVEQELPPFDRPTLYGEDAGLAPQRYGAGTPGSGGFAPRIVGIEPPALGNPGFTVAVDGALGGARAMLAVAARDAPGGAPFRGTTSHLALASGRTRWFAVPQIDGIGPGQGFGSVSLELPGAASWQGTVLYAQWFVLDPGAASGVAASDALRLALY